MVNYKTLDLNLLRVFEALATTRNVTRAGEVLGLSQPAVSAALARLRHQLGDPLFIRVRNGMVPTERADRIAPQILAALEAMRTTLSEAETFDPAEAEMVFTLRGTDFFSMRLMPVLAGRLAQEAPGITLRFLDSAHGRLEDDLESGEVDMALEQPSEVPPWVSSATMFEAPFRVIAARRNRVIADAGIAAGASLPMALFCALPHAMRSVDGSMTGRADRALAEIGKSRRVMLVLPHFESVMRAVAQSEMIATVPEQLADERAGELELVVFDPPIPIPVPKIPLYWHARNDHAPAHVWMRDQVLSEVRRLWSADAVS